jgi:hypothetical protein
MHRNYNNYLNIIISGFKRNFGVSTEQTISSNISQDNTIYMNIKKQLHHLLEYNYIMFQT